VRTLSDLHYQDEAVVSTVLLKGPGGSVTAFAFAAGQELSEHTAPFDALVQLVEGRMRITIGGEPHDLEAGSFLVMPASVPHALLALEPAKMILSMIRDPAA